MCGVHTSCIVEKALYKSFGDRLVEVSIFYRQAFEYGWRFDFCFYCRQCLLLFVIEIVSFWEQSKIVEIEASVLATKNFEKPLGYRVFVLIPKSCFAFLLPKFIYSLPCLRIPKELLAQIFWTSTLLYFYEPQYKCNIDSPRLPNFTCVVRFLYWQYRPTECQITSALYF